MLVGKLRYIKNNVRNFSSALYITGDKAQKNFAVLTPVIDFDSQLANKADLIENIKLRQLSININNLEERWNFFKDVSNRKNTLDQTRIEIGQTIAKFMKLKTHDSINLEIEKLKSHLKIIKDDFRNLRNMSYSIEEAVYLQVLSLPNVLHPMTPSIDELEVYSYLEKPVGKTENHLTISHCKKYIKYINHMSCYFKSDAAIFELALQNYFVSKLLDLSYVHFSNSDFVKSVVVEGCGSNPFDNSEVLTIKDMHCVKSDGVNKLHLVGASSLYSFMAYFTKHFVQTTQLPMKTFCYGRRYRVVDQDSQKNFFNLNQSSEIGIFIATLKNPNILENIIENVTMLYKPLGYHFRLVLTPANKLRNSESLKLSIQMFSNHLNVYVEVGSISLYEDYLSKRLLFNYSEDKERKYPNIIGGPVINIQKVLGCVLENTSIENLPLLSDFLVKFID